MSVSLYDCTVREGKPLGAVEERAEVISQLENGLSNAGIQYMDVGYLCDETFSSDFAFYGNIDQAENLIPRGGDTNWAISIQLGRNELNLIPECHGRIKTIRFVVPYKGFDVLETYAGFIKDKGYEVICEIDNTFGYEDIDVLRMIEAANKAGVSQLTFSNRTTRIYENDLMRMYNLFHNNLSSEIRIGARLSDAFKDAYQMMQKLVEMNEPDEREIVIEGSLFGIGSNQGNLILEVAADYYNDFHDGNFNLDVMYELIGRYIQPIVKNQSWGYHPAYYMAGKYKVDSDYAQYLLDRDVPLVRINGALKKLAKTEEYKEYDETIAEKILQEI